MQLSDAATGDAIHPKTIPRPVEIAKPVTSEHDSARVLTAALDTIITILNAEKSAIIFFLDSDKLQIFSGRNSKKETIGGSEFNVNASLLSEVKITGKPLCS
ncbi:hypothetical protein GWO43_30455, partial [candidate division KSB1 bacterium]|nr:hypothetical protein [candidate division KSB1 bacterium]NIR72688.1 hypothetical protein [candidate division KSB1 bacterium]NIS28215.1 hypothetical protein [candidate division KSB1 bacterium]NIT75105.1 hypothetical protein [candidate division KSB1 bacterium]NIU28891.1 hypothetical protein [candidate division KSB1 bacterium]